MDQREQQLTKEIDDTRAAMTEKIEMIEERVHETMEGTKSKIANVMDNVKRVQGTVDQTKSTLDNIIQTIKDSMDETIERVKYTADLIEQVNKNPWIMFGGAILAGYVLSSITRTGSLAGHHAAEHRTDISVPASTGAAHELS